MAATPWNFKIYLSILLSVFMVIIPTSTHGEYSSDNKRLSNSNAPIVLIVGDNLRPNHKMPRHSNRYSVYDRYDNLDQDYNARSSQLSPDISNLLASLFSYKTLSSSKNYKRPKDLVGNNRYNRYRASSHYKNNKNSGKSYNSNYYKNDRDNVKIYNEKDKYKTIILDRNDKLNFNDHSYRNDRYIPKSENYRSQYRDKRYNDKQNRLDGDGDEPLVKTLLQGSNVLRKKDSCEDSDSCEVATTTEDPCDQNGNSCDVSDNNISTRGIPSEFVSEVPPNCC